MVKKVFHGVQGTKGIKASCCVTVKDVCLGKRVYVKAADKLDVR